MDVFTFLEYAKLFCCSNPRHSLKRAQTATSKIMDDWNALGVQKLLESDHRSAIIAFSNSLRQIERLHSENKVQTEDNPNRPSSNTVCLQPVALPIQDRPALAEEQSLTPSFHRFFNRCFLIETGNGNLHLSVAIAFYNLGATYHHAAMNTIHCETYRRLCSKATQCYNLGLHAIGRSQLTLETTAILLLALYNNQAHMTSLTYSYDIPESTRAMEQIAKILGSICTKSIAIEENDLNFFSLNTLLFRSKAFSVGAPAA